MAGFCLPLQWQPCNFLSSIPSDDLICFTDGSVLNPDAAGLGPCGAGIVVYEFGMANPPTIQAFKVSDKSTPYHGEIEAIRQALIKCLSLTKKKKRNHIHLLSDCQSAIITVTSSCPNDNCTQEITDILKISHELRNNGTKTSISWIGGHADIEANEIADTAAKEGAMLKEKPISDRMTYKCMKKILQRNSTRIWQMTWDNTKTGLHLKDIQDTVSLEATYSLPKQRKLQKIFHQLRIGRSELNAQDPINKKETEEKKCNHCGAFEDTRHYHNNSKIYIYTIKVHLIQPMV